LYGDLADDERIMSNEQIHKDLLSKLIDEHAFWSYEQSEISSILVKLCQEFYINRGISSVFADW
jgi:hypothetical protein